MKMRYSLINLIVVFTLILALLSWSTAIAEVIYVDINSTGIGETGHYLTPFKTIQKGIDAASTGDTVHVADGIYTGQGNKNLNFGGKAITVQSESGPIACIIDCEKSGQGFLFQNSENNNAVLDGFTITNSFAWDGGAIACKSSSPKITNCIFYRNEGQDDA